MAIQSRSAQVIFAALALGQLAFLGLALVIQRSIVPPEGLNQTLVAVFGFLAVVFSAGASWFIGKRLAERASTLQDTAERAKAILSSITVRLALAEGASFAVIAIYLVTGEPLMLGLFVLSFCVFVIQRPREEELLR